MIGRRVHVRSTKYDGSPHWEFDSWLTLEKGPLLVTINFIGEVMRTWRGPWTNPYHSRNYDWSDRWYNVIRLERSEGGEFEGWYCNVTTPAEFDGEHLAYADLDLDVRVSAEGEVEILDEDENVDAIAMEVGAGFLARRMRENPAILDALLDTISAHRERSAKPFITIAHAGHLEDVSAMIRSRLLERDIPPFATFQAGAKALRRAIDYWRLREGLD